MSIRVLIVDDNPVVRAGLANLVALEEDICVCGEAGTGDAALLEAGRHSPDVVLLDVRMPSRDGLSVLPELVDRCRVLMLTHSEELEVVAHALRDGATGYLVHGSFSSAELLTAIRDTAAGRMRLSPEAAQVIARRPEAGAPAPGVRDAHEVDSGLPAGVQQRFNLSAREVEICGLVVQGFGNAEIARQLFIEAKTVKNHLNRIFAKLGVSTRAQAIAVCLGTSTVERGSES